MRYLDILARQAEQQGAKVVKKPKGGYRITPPDGQMISLHQTPGDNRHWKNLRVKWVRRGLEWPWKTDAP